MAAPRAKNSSRVRVSLTTYEAASATLAELWKKIWHPVKLGHRNIGWERKKKREQNKDQRSTIWGRTKMEEAEELKDAHS